MSEPLLKHFPRKTALSESHLTKRDSENLPTFVFFASFVPKPHKHN
jgi:hypothetical protein